MQEKKLKKILNVLLWIVSTTAVILAVYGTCIAFSK